MLRSLSWLLMAAAGSQALAAGAGAGAGGSTVTSPAGASDVTLSDSDWHHWHCMPSLRRIGPSL